MIPTHLVALLGAVFLLLYLAIWLWQNPGTILGAMGRDDVERYMRSVARLPFPAEERAEMLRRVRAWLENDDGKPVYMLNLMRFYRELRRFEGSLPFEGSPRESNARYEATVIPLLFRVGAYPVFAGSAQGPNVMSYEPELDAWHRILVVRYPNRRAFMKLMTHPAFQRVEPYKLMALKVVLTPMRPQMVFPELPFVAAATLLPLFLAVGWWCGTHAG